jgi:putative FmdB family regulatory protein
LGFEHPSGGTVVPLYEYKCQKCGRHTEKIESVSGPHLKKCPHCGGKVESVITAPAIKFKGSGWYVNDYAGKSSATDPAKTESSSGDAKESSSKDAGSKDSGKDGSTKESSSKESASKDSSAKDKKTTKKN